MCRVSDSEAAVAAPFALADDAGSDDDSDNAAILSPRNDDIAPDDMWTVPDDGCAGYV